MQSSRTHPFGRDQPAADRGRVGRRRDVVGAPRGPYAPLAGGRGLQGAALPGGRLHRRLHARQRRPGHVSYIRHFFVLHEHRGRGAGRRAMELLLEEIIPPSSRVTLDVLASNETGRHFWRSVGFRDYAIRLERLAESPSA